MAKQIDEIYSSEDRYYLAGGSKPVPHLSDAALYFAEEHSRLLDFHLFFKEALLANSLKGLNKTEINDNDSIVNQHVSIVNEIVICRVAENFLCFISDLLALIYKHKPSMLKSSETERIDFILNYDSMDDLLSGLAEKRVERLAYLSLLDLSEYFSKHMSFELFTNSTDLNRAAIIIEYRNTFVHNRGIISRTSARRFKELEGLVDKTLDISGDYVTELRKFLENAVIDIDIRATKKFSLPTNNLPPFQ